MKLIKVSVILYFFLLVILQSCQQIIRNENATVKDEVMDSAATEKEQISENNRVTNNAVVNNEDDLYGFWVGDFEQKEENESIRSQKAIAKDEGLYWNRTNKINITITKLENGKVYGHSVVAGNYRPFEGTYEYDENTYKFIVKEPGDDQYDGIFKFQIEDGSDVLTGTWTAFKNIDIKHREYTLQKKQFNYNPDQNLLTERRYVNWNKEIRTEFMNEIDEESFLDFSLQFESATDDIYKYNASNTLLTKNDVENLHQGDLFIIRNTIYARHGYSFKNRPLRVFFDAQSWYIPVHTNIKKDLTPVELENIKLLLKYEKNAKAYYDSFGRG